jgi:segregation and condensation protein B
MKETPYDRHIEALIFAATAPIAVEEIRAATAEALQLEITTEQITEGIDSLFERYKSDLYAFEPAEMAGGYQFLSKGAYHNTIAVHLKLTTKKRLSTAAMETLALIAYRQPIAKSEMEQLRGVSCDYAIQKLLEKELVYIAGRSEGPGKPLLYGTSEKFMEYMGIRSMDDLPKLKDFKDLENEIGESSDLQDSALPPSEFSLVATELPLVRGEAIRIDEIDLEDITQINMEEEPLDVERMDEVVTTDQLPTLHGVADDIASDTVYEDILPESDENTSNDTTTG